MRNKRFVISARQFFFSLMILVGWGMSCTPTPAPPSVEQSRLLGTTEKVVEKVTTPAPTFIVTPTRQSATTTFTLTAVSKTVTPVPSPTLTPLPTLDPEQAISFTESLMIDNAGCRLPCWWGINPGKSSWVEVEQFTRSFATQIGQGGTGWIEENGKKFLTTNYSVDYQTRKSPGIVTYYVRDGIITSISVGNVGTHYYYSLLTILLQYGIPNEIYINTYSDSYGDGVLPFDIALFYPDQGISMIFRLQGERVADAVRGCIDPASDQILKLWAPESNRPFEDLKAFGLDTGKEKTLETATALNVDTFYEIATTSSGVICIETPAELWP